MLGHLVNWKEHSYEYAWRGWLSDRARKPVKALPSILSWGVWISQKKDIFQDTPSSLEAIVSESVGILSHYPQEKDGKPVQIIQQEVIDKTYPWFFFMGLIRGNPKYVGQGGV